MNVYYKQDLRQVEKLTFGLGISEKSCYTENLRLSQRAGRPSNHVFTCGTTYE
jgi:hypothetical protein